MFRFAVAGSFHAVLMKFFVYFLAHAFRTSTWTCFNTLPFWSLVLVVAHEAKNSWSQPKLASNLDPSPCSKCQTTSTHRVVPSGCSSHGTCLLGISWGGLSKLHIVERSKKVFSKTWTKIILDFGEVQGCTTIGNSVTAPWGQRLESPLVRLWGVRNQLYLIRLGKGSELGCRNKRKRK